MGGTTKAGLLLCRATEGGGKPLGYAGYAGTRQRGLGGTAGLINYSRADNGPSGLPKGLLPQWL